MGSASWAIYSESMRARGRGIIVSVKSNQLAKNIETKQLQRQLELDFNPFLPPKRRRFSLLVGYNIQPSSSSTNQNAALIIDHQLDFTNMGYDHCSRRLQLSNQATFVAFLQHPQTCPWHLVLFFFKFLSRTVILNPPTMLSWDCRVHFFRQPFSEWLLLLHYRSKLNSG